jgi:Cu/Ag efflux protein CusF
MNKFVSLTMACALQAAGASWADQSQASGHDMPTMQLAQADSAMTDGEVRKIDKEAGKITLKHGELKNLGMPAMTMVFQVKDAALLDKVKAGDKVRFTAEKADSGFVVSKIEAAR